MRKTATDWTIEFSPQARVEYRSLPVAVRREVRKALPELREDPRSPGTKPMQFGPRLHRKLYLPSGYRLIYIVSEPHRKIYIDRIRPHQAAYTGFSD